MTWYIFKTDALRERQAEALIARLGFETFRPLEPRYKSVSRHTKRRTLFYISLLPRCVFVQDNGTEISDLTALKYIRGMARTHSGEALKATDREMVQFRLAHEQWAASLMGAKRNEPRAKTKPIKLGDMSRLSEIMDVCFGSERDDGEQKELAA